MPEEDRHAALDVLNLPDILTGVVGQLSRHEALKLRTVCKTLRSTIALIGNNVQFKQRLLVVASESNKLIEVDPVMEDVVRCRPVRKPSSRRAKTNEWWPTSIALCPYNGDFYICQYAGRSVRRFSGASLNYVRIAAELPACLSSPEGICFSKNSMYVVSANAAAVARFPYDTESGEFAASLSDVSYVDSGAYPGHAIVPWTMIAGPDANLFLAVDIDYTALHQHKRTVGMVLTARLSKQGTKGVPGSMHLFHLFCGGDRLMRRPSGLAFDNQGYLYVTSFCNMGQVLMYKGPLLDKPGAFVRVAVAWENSPLSQGLGALLPWDVQWSPGIPGIGVGPLLFVTRHNGQRHAKAGLASRVSIYCAISGACIKEIFSSRFKQANMMALA